MLMMSKSCAMAAVVSVGLFGAQGPPPSPPESDGWGSTSCSNIPSPACGLDAGTPEGGGGSDGAPVGAGPRRRAPEGEDSGGLGADQVPNEVKCSYVKSDFQPPRGGVVTVSYRRPLREDGVIAQPAVFRPAAAPRMPGAGPEDGEDGAWYVWKCTGSDAVDALFRPPVWIVDGEQGGVALPSAAELARRAHSQLTLAVPSIAASPVGDQLVNLPTWLWLDGGWAPVSATAAVPGVSVTATATPTSVTWAMGDGQTVTCTEPGTPFVAGRDPRMGSPDCGYTYRRSSAAQPGQVFAVSATVNWTVTWAGAGQEGTFPDLKSTGNAQFRVAESQSLNNGG